MDRTLRIGTQIWPDDPFWVHVRESILLHAEQLGVELVTIESEAFEQLGAEAQLEVVEELLALELDALIGWSLNDELTCDVLASDLPVIHLGESSVRHPRFVSPQGLYAIAYELGTLLAERLDGQGSLLVVGGGQGYGEDGQSRRAGLQAALRAYPHLQVRYLAAPWRYEAAYTVLQAALDQLPTLPAAIFGLSDTLALAARDLLRQRKLLHDQLVLVGINGDPLALAAIAEGSMTATVLTSGVEFGRQALALAVCAGRGQPLPAHFSYNPQLVTRQNVTQVAAQQLYASAALPSRLIGVNRQQEQRRMRQLETSLAISRQAGMVLERGRLAYVIANLIRDSYGYDEVQILRWDDDRQQLWREHTDQLPHRATHLALEQHPTLATAIRQGQPIFIPDLRHSQRFIPDPACPEIRARMVVPIRLGGELIGLLDLQRYRSAQHTHHDLIGLQTLADQLGVAMRNTELYEQARTAQQRAERADQLKTRLLANVSHELRTPLNLILGYSQTAMQSLAGQGNLDPALLQRDLQRIYQSGEHLIRLINDLLDLSRATIGELDLFPETIQPRAFLEELFQSVTEAHTQRTPVSWHLNLPSRLPVVQADPVRLRQVLLNLLDNARKFTAGGQISLGAEVQVPYLHLWVADTGSGIPPELQEQIFESFISEPGSRSHQGIGLGLTIARQLVQLHGGSITLESQVGQGSTFHVYLPLPNLVGRVSSSVSGAHPALLLIGADQQRNTLIADLCRRQGLILRCLQSRSDLQAALAETQPVGLAWNLAERVQSEAGWQLFQQIRSLPQIFNLPLILYHQEGEEHNNLPNGLTSVLLKPLAVTRLVEALERVRPATASGPILIVDDDPQAHTIYRRILAEHLPGYPIRSAYGGAEALELLAHTKPCLLILDLTMPEIDGFHVLEHLRGQAATSQVPVLVISGRMLSGEDIQRLDRARVIFHSKEALSSEAAATIIARALATRESLPQHTSSLVKHAVAYMQQNYQRSLSRQEIADAIGVNKDYLSRIFQRELGLSPWDYLNRYRIGRARELLRHSHTSINVIATEVGFSDPAYFSRVFHKEVGCSPREYREGGGGSPAIA